MQTKLRKYRSESLRDEYAQRGLLLLPAVQEGVQVQRCLKPHQAVQRASAKVSTGLWLSREIQGCGTTKQPFGHGMHQS